MAQIPVRRLVPQLREEETHTKTNGSGDRWVATN